MLLTRSQLSGTAARPRRAMEPPAQTRLPPTTTHVAQGRHLPRMRHSPHRPDCVRRCAAAANVSRLEGSGASVRWPVRRRGRSAARRADPACRPTICSPPGSPSLGESAGHRYCRQPRAADPSSTTSSSRCRSVIATPSISVRIRAASRRTGAPGSPEARETRTVHEHPRRGDTAPRACVSALARPPAAQPRLASRSTDVRVLDLLRMPLGVRTDCAQRKDPCAPGDERLIGPGEVRAASSTTHP